MALPADIATLIGRTRSVGPDKGDEAAELATTALIIGTLSAFMTAGCAGILG